MTYVVRCVRGRGEGEEKFNTKYSAARGKLKTQTTAKGKTTFS